MPFPHCLTLWSRTVRLVTTNLCKTAIDNLVLFSCFLQTWRVWLCILKNIRMWMVHFVNEKSKGIVQKVYIYHYQNVINSFMDNWLDKCFYLFHLKSSKSCVNMHHWNSFFSLFLMSFPLRKKTLRLRTQTFPSSVVKYRYLHSTSCCH